MMRRSILVLALTVAALPDSGFDMATASVVRSTRTAAVNERQLVSATRDTGVPRDGAVASTPTHLWWDHRLVVVVAVTVGLLQTGLIVWLIFERRRRKIAEGASLNHLLNAAQLDRRASLGEMSAALAHELNQPLGAILHNAEAAEMAIESGQVPLPELREILADIREADIRAGEIISRMRSLLQKHELDTRPLDVNDLARETLALVVPSATDKGVCIDLDLAPGLSPVLGDRVHLQQVLLNVLLNGMEAMTTLPRATRLLIVRTAHRKHSVEVSVKDSGCGIAPDVARHIFDPFYSTKAQGMGVGLFIARSIIEAHGGRIAAENNRDRGATVRFTLPIQRAHRSA